MPIWAVLANFAGFQVVWLIAVVYGNFGAIASIAVFLVVHVFVLLRIFQNCNLHNELYLLLFALALGILVEVIFTTLGVWTFPEFMWPPVWLLVLWIGFGMCVRLSFGFIKGRMWLAAVIGGFFAPFSYIGGAHFSATHDLSSHIYSLPIIAIAWALVMPALIFMAQKLPIQNPQAESMRGSNLSAN